MPVKCIHAAWCLGFVLLLSFGLEFLTVLCFHLLFRSHSATLCFVFICMRPSFLWVVFVTGFGDTDVKGCSG